MHDKEKFLQIHNSTAEFLIFSAEAGESTIEVRMKTRRSGSRRNWWRSCLKLQKSTKKRVFSTSFIYILYATYIFDKQDLVINSFIWYNYNYACRIIKQSLDNQINMQKFGLELRRGAFFYALWIHSGTE